MAYPASLDELTDGVPSDGTAAATSLGDATYPLDDWARAISIAVEAVEAELGTAPSGASATVAARFGTLTADVFTGAVSFGGGISLTGTSSVADRKITMQGFQVVYLPDQASFAGCLFLGVGGGGALAAGAEHNTAVGMYAGGAITSGTENTVMGQGAFYAGTTGSQNTVLGRVAGFSLTTGGANVTVGYNAGNGITTGGSNVVVGASIIGLPAAAANLTLAGHQAGASSTQNNLTALGFQAGVSQTGTESTFVGVLAGGSNTGTTSTAVGMYAGISNTGNNLAALGNRAGYTNTGADVTAVGTAAGYANTGSSLVAVGYSAANACSGSSVVALGYYSAYSNTGSSVTALGHYSAVNNTYDHVVMLGRGAVATAANQFVVGSASSQQTKWVPGHDTDTYFDIATANTWKVVAGGTERLTLNATKPTVTGSRGGNAALADLLTKLAAMNLITDSTS